MAVRQVLGAGAAPLHGMVAGASRAGGRRGTSSEALAGEQYFGRQQGVRGLILGGTRLHRRVQLRPGGDEALHRRAQPTPSGDRGSLPPGAVDSVMM